MPSKYSWKLGQWWSRQHIRLALCLTWLLGCMLLSALAGFAPLDDAWRHNLTMLRSAYEVPSERALLVSLDEDYARQHGSPPHDIAQLADALDLLAPHALVTLVYTEAGAVWHGKIDASRLCTHPRVIFYGPAPAPWLHPSCTFIQTSLDPPPAALFSPVTSGSEAELWRAVETRSSSSMPEQPGFISYGTLPPVLAMQALDATREQDVLIGGRAVVLAPTAHQPLHDLPSGRRATREHVRAHVLATLLEDALLETTARELVWLCAMLAMAIAASLSARRHMLRDYLLVTLGWLLLCALAMLALALFLPPFMPLVTGWGGVVILRLVPPRMSDLRVDVRSRLLEVTRDVTSERAHLISREQTFWQESLERANALIPGVQCTLLAELPEGSWWIVPRAYLGMREQDLFERRRDIRREPYETPLQMRRGVLISRQFLQDQDLDVILAPLTQGDRVLGFWMLATSAGQGRALLSSQGARIKQLSGQLAREIAWRRLESRQTIRAATATSGVDLLVDEALLTLEQIALQKEVLEQVVDGAQVGLMLISLLGEIVFSNEVMAKHLGSLLDDATQSSGLEATIASIHEEIEDVDALIASTLAGQMYAWERQVGDDERGGLARRTLSLSLSPVRGSDIDQITSLLITSHDVTQLTERESQRAAMMRLFNARSVDVTSTIQGYVDVLAQSTSLSKAEKRVVERLSKSVEALDAQVHDMLGVLEQHGQTEFTRLIPVNLRFVISSFLRGRRAEHASIEVTWPDDALWIVRAKPDVLWQVLRLICDEFEQWRAEHATMRIEVSRRASRIALCLSLSQSTLPQSLLRQIAEDRGEAASEALQRARELIEGLGDQARLELRHASGQDDVGALSAILTLPEVDVS